MNAFTCSSSSGWSLSTPNAYCSSVRSYSITLTTPAASSFFSAAASPAVVSVLFSAAAVVSVVLPPQPVRSDAAIAAVKHNAIAFFIICSSSNPIRICNFFDETHYTTGLYKKQVFMHVFLHIYAVSLIL